jgi:hypothetical protein
MFSNSQVPWKRILAEFVAITVAVYLGLLADNYREYRVDKKTEREYLRLLAGDLDSDLETLQFTKQGIEAQARAAQSIHSAVGGEDIAISDIEKAFSQLFLSWTYEQQRPTYLALRDGIGLHIISSQELRAALTSYYEVEQMRLQQDYMTNYSKARWRLREGLGKHVRFLPPGEFDSLSSIPDDFHVVRAYSSVSTLGKDIEFMNDIAEIGGRGFELTIQIDQVRTANREVHELIISASH